MIVDLILMNTKTYTNKKIINCDLAINNGSIIKIGKKAKMPKSDVKIDLKNLLVLPGLIDNHVHLRDEGKSYKENFYTGTAAAALGGVTTVIDMPNNLPVTNSAKKLKYRMKKAENQIVVNVGFCSEFPNNLMEIQNIITEGAIAFKLFLNDRIGGLNINDDDALLKSFKMASKLKFLINVHAEDREKIIENKRKLLSRNGSIKDFLKIHSEKVETKAVQRLIRIVRQTDAKLHFCHVSSEKGLKKIIDGKKEGINITCEVTPHHLLLSLKDLEGKKVFGITTPPIREIKHSKFLWYGIKTGWIDLIASDHAPHTLKEKEGKTVCDVKPGIPGLETMLPLLLTEIQKGRLTIGDIVKFTAENPANLLGLKNRGVVKKGNYADLIVVDINQKYKIDVNNFFSKAKYSPFNLRMVTGKIIKTFVKGQLIMDEGEIIAKPGNGNVIRKSYI